MNHLHTVSRSGTTRARKLASIRHFLGFLKENDVIAGNPAETIKRAKKEEKEPAVLYKNEYKAILFEAQDNPRNFAILMMFLQTGIRESELTHLKLEDIDLEHGELTVRQGKGKKDRSIPLEPQSLKALQQYLAVRDEQLIIDEDILFLARNGTSMNERTIRKLVKKYYDLAGVKKRGVHTLRHTFGAHKIANKMSIATLQKLMGHNRKETTLKYVHIAHTNIKQEQIDTAL
jgi:site-specific recombinase XerD